MEAGEPGVLERSRIGLSVSEATSAKDMIKIKRRERYRGRYGR